MAKTATKEDMCKQNLKKIDEEYLKTEKNRNILEKEENKRKEELLQKMDEIDKRVEKQNMLDLLTNYSRRKNTQHKEKNPSLLKPILETALYFPLWSKVL